MRYQIDAVTGGIGDPAVHIGVLVATAFYTLLVGIGICALGLHKRVGWAIFMGGTLAGVSTVYLGAIVLGYA